jgi:hypothetical protein
MIENSLNNAQQNLGIRPEFTGQGAIEGADPWVHRAEGMRCRSCIWYVAKVPTNPNKPEDYRGLGRCRRHAPTMNGYPVVWCDDWCGDHRLDENKL